MSGVASWTFHSCLFWRSFFITLSPRRTEAIWWIAVFKEPSLLLLLPWRVQLMFVTLVGPRSRGLVVEMPATWSSCFRVAYYSFFTAKFSWNYLTALRPIRSTRFSPLRIVQGRSVRSILFWLVSLVFRVRASASSWSFYGVWSKNRYWLKIVAVGEFSRIERYMVLRRLLPLSLRCFTNSALPRWCARSDWCFSRLLGLCWQRSQLRSCGSTCGEWAVATYRAKDKFREATRGALSCRRCFSSSVDCVVDVFLEALTASVAGDIFSDNLLRRIAKVPELQMKYDHFVA